MELKTPKQYTSVSDTFTKAKMSLDVDDIDGVVRVLREQIYPDKVRAVIREYTSNALDEHKKHNIQRPVEVSFDEETFKVRDFGLGLSTEFIFNTYIKIGKSEKRTNKTLMGCYGYGSKSGHAYGDQFYVTSFYEGKKTTYVAILEEGQYGIPVGNLYQIAELNSTEPSGIEITIPVKKDDVYNFKRTIIEFLKGVRTEIIFNDKIFNDKLSKFEDTNHLKGDNTMVRVGDVIYDLPFKTKLNDYSIKITLDIPINTVSIPPSRECIDNTPRNIKIVNEIVDELIQKKIQVLNEQFKTLPLGKCFQLINKNQINKAITNNNKFYKDGVELTQNYTLEKILNHQESLKKYSKWFDAYKLSLIEFNRTYPRVDKISVGDLSCSSVFYITKKPCGRVLAKKIKDFYNTRNLLEYVILETTDNKELIEFIRKNFEYKEIDESLYTVKKPKKAKPKKEDLEFSSVYKYGKNSSYGWHCNLFELEDLDVVFYNNYSDIKLRTPENYYKLTKDQQDYLRKKGVTLIHYEKMDEFIRKQLLKTITKSARYKYIFESFIDEYEDYLEILDRIFGISIKDLYKIPRKDFEKELTDLKKIKFYDTNYFKKIFDEMKTIMYNKAPKWKLDAINELRHEGHTKAIDILKKYNE